MLGCGAVLRPPDPDRRLEIRTSGELFEASAGYTFAVLPEPTAKVVRLDFRYPVGHVDDPIGKEGLAHLLEHLLFEVVIRRGAAETSVSAELGRVALGWNAVTTPDHTTFQVTAEPESLDEAFGLLVDQMVIGCGGLTPAIFAREREVVLNELREKEGANGALQQTVHAALYPEGHAYRRNASLASVAKLELKDVCDLLGSTYLRGKVMVVASGWVTSAEIQQIAGKHLRRARKRLPAAALAIPPLQPRPETVRVRGAVDEPTLIAAWPLPPMATRDYRILERAWPAVAAILERFAYTYEWGHSSTYAILGGARAPVLAVAIELNAASDLDEAITAARKSVENAARTIHRSGGGAGGDDNAQWNAQRESHAAQVLAAWENLDARNEMVGDMLQFETGRELVIGRVAELQQMSGGTARGIVERWLAPDLARYVLVEPNGDSSPALRSTYGGGGEGHATRVDGALADKPLPAPNASFGTPAETYQLGNGLTVVLWPHGTAPLVMGRLVVDSGQAHDPAGKEGTAVLAGADASYEDQLVYRTTTLATRVDDLVVSLGLELRSAGYGLSDKAKDYARARLKAPRVRERTAYELDLVSAVYGKGHPYARLVTDASLGHLSHDSVLAWARGHVVPRNAVLVIAGKFDPALVKKHVAFNLDQVASGADSPDIAVAPQPRPGAVAGLTAHASHTIELDVLFGGGRGYDRDHASRLILEHVLALRLASLRTAKALTYGFSAAYTARESGGVWRISGSADANRAGEATKLLADILAEVRRDPESYRTDFVLARQKVLEGLLASSTSSSTIVERLVAATRFDLPNGYHDKLAAEIAATTLAKFHPFVARELAADRQVFGAFGTAGAVEAALRALPR